MNIEKGSEVYVTIPLYHRRIRGLFKFRKCKVTAIQDNEKISVKPTDENHKWGITINKCPPMKDGVIYSFLQKYYYTEDEQFALRYNQLIDEKLEKDLINN